MNTRLVIFCISLAAFAGCAHTDQPTRSAEWGGYYFRHEHSNAPPTDPVPTYLELPPVPTGCVVRVYRVTPHWLSDMPRTKTDWAEFLRAQGVIFPRGGFAVYFPPTSTLVVANTPEQLRLLDPF